MESGLNRRHFLASVGGGAAVAAGLPGTTQAAEAAPNYDVIVVGGGNAGMPTAIFAAQRGARVLILDAAGILGGTLHLSSGQMSAAGTKLQKSKGIQDTPDIFYDDVMRISHNTADPTMTRLAVDNSADTFDWLTDRGLDLFPEHPVTGTTHEPYSRERYAWGKSGGRSILRILNAEIEPLIAAGKIDVKLNTRVKELVRDASGAVVGVVAADDEAKITRYAGRNVVLTSGGCASNPAMFEQLDEIHDYNNDSYPFSQGDGITLGLGAGGRIWGRKTRIPLFGGILSEAEYPSPLLQIFRPWPPARPPFEIFVNKGGKRFVQEDIPSHDTIEQGLLAQKDTVCWIVFDDAMFAAAPPIMNPKRWNHEQYAALFNKQAFFHKADSVEALAALAGIDAKGLIATVATFNAGQAQGVDALGRKHMPLPLAKGPFYAIKLHSWKYTNYAGLAVNGDLRVVDKGGKPVPGLYAAGEIIGNGTTMGRSVCGGMSVTPALTFGRLLGQRILQFAV
jgi:fumarate reductase flavoprotein subunit